MPVVYIDVLFAVNFCLNYLILWATARLAGVRARGWRVFLSALLGTVYALCMFFPELDGLFLTASKLAMSVVLIAVAFGVGHFKEFAKLLGLFYLVCFTFGGIVAGLFFLSGSFGANAIVSGGTLYVDLPWTVLAVSAGGAFLVLTLTVKHIKAGIFRSGLHSTLTIVCEGRSAVLDAFMDTGNNLTEPITGSPVIVAELERIAGLLPQDLCSQIKAGGVQNVFDTVRDEKWLTRLRLIPFSVLGLEHGMLAGFRPDYAILDHEKGRKTVSDCIIAIYSGSLSNKNGCAAILNPDIIA